MTLATDEQMAALTVPATLPGVVRDCTPLVSHTGRRKGIVTYRTGHGWVVVLRHMPPSFDPDCDDDDIDYAAGSDSEGPGAAGWRVDLTDATGRAHVAWAIGAVFGSATAVWGRTNVGWAFMLDDGSTRDYCAQISPLSEDCHCGNNTRLPDGSRFVDALALKAVAMHVLGSAQ